MSVVTGPDAAGPDPIRIGATGTDDVAAPSAVAPPGASRPPARSSLWVGQPAFVTTVRVVAFALLLWAVVSEVHARRGDHLAAWVVAATLAPAWVGWSATPLQARWPRLVSLAWLAAGGGALSVAAPAALGFVGAAALGAAAGFELPQALAVAGFGPAVLAVAATVDGRSLSLVLGGLAASLGGLVVGVGRRQATERARQATLVAVEHERAELERVRAGVLEERNRLGREVHDILAHSLGALVVQLEALDAQFGEEPGTPPSLREGLRRTRSLAVEGLVEARRAVRALRDDAVALESQLRKLCEGRGVALVVTGEARSLSPETTLALYRVAQESLTNAAKHAPGAPVAVRLDFDAASVALSVHNGAATGQPGELARSGGGFGVDGIRERVRLLGGEVTAGPHGPGWCVQAVLPR